MITLATFSKPEEADLLRGRLEVAGIPAFVRDAYTVQSYWLYSNALGGIRVEVPEPFAAAAREIMDLPPIQEDPPAADGCPRCGSDQIERRDWPRRLAFLSVLLVSFPLLVSRQQMRCRACRFTWR